MRQSFLSIHIDFSFFQPIRMLKHGSNFLLKLIVAYFATVLFSSQICAQIVNVEDILF